MKAKSWQAGQMAFLGIILLLGAAAQVAAADAGPAASVSAGYTTPRITVPYAWTKPTIDGTVNDAEWQAAASVKALQTTARAVSTRQTRFWIMWDEDSLYVAMRSPLREGERPVDALRDRNADINVVFDDAYELFFDVGTRSKDGQPCFFQFLSNFYGTRYDVMFEPAVGNSRIGYSSGWQPKNRLTPDGKAWEMELRIPRDSLFVQTPFHDGMLIRSLFARDFKRPWEQNSFEGTGNFSQKETFSSLLLAKNAPAIHLLGVADVAKPSFGVALAAFSRAAQELKWVFESDGGVKKEGTLVLAPQAVATAAAGLDLEPAAGDKPGEGFFRIRVTSADGQVIYLDWCAKRAFGGKPEVAAQKIDDKGDVVTLSLTLNPVADYLKVTGDFIQYDNRAAIDKCRVTVSGQGGKVLATKEMALDPDAYVKSTIPLGTLTPGTYAAKLVCLDRDGKTILEREEQCEKKDPAKAFAWWNTTAGNIEKVIDPWTPVTYDQGAFGVWGRTMAVGPAGLPAQMTSQGRKLLAAPGALIIELQDGTRLVAGKPRLKTLSSAEQRVVVEAESTAGDLKVTSTVTVEFDGMYKVSLRLEPGKPLPVKSVKIVVPLRNEEADYVHAAGAGIRSGFYYGFVPTDKQGSLWDSRTVDSQPTLVGSFIPSVWVGNTQAGLCWFADSDEGWNPNNDVPALELRRDGKSSTDLVLNLVSAPVVLDAPRTVLFAFIATPVKKMHAQWRLDNWWCGSTFYDFSGVSKKGGSLIWTSIPFTLDPEACKALVEKYHKGTVAGGPLNPAVPYWEYNSFGYFAPEPAYFREQWQLSGEKGFWFDKSFTDYIVYNLENWAQTTGIDGWYLDNCRPVACAKIEAGRGYRLPDGRIQPAFSTFETRTFFLRVRAAFLEAGRQPWIVAHMTNHYMPAWCWDVAYDGELNVIYPESGKDFMDLWSLERMRLANSDQWGFMVNFMQEYQGDWSKIPERYGKALRAFIGLAALQDAVPSGNIRTMPCYYTFLKARQTFGIGAADVLFRGYWDTNSGVHTTTKGIYPAVWTRPGKILLLLANLGEKTDAVVTLDPKALGLGSPGNWTVSDGEAGGQVAITGADGKPVIVKNWDPAMAPIRHDDKGQLTVPVDRHDYRQILIETVKP